MVKNVFGMGNPLLDIASEVESDVLKKYDLKPGNACLADPKHLPLYAELAARPDVQYIPGGATLNAIRVCNWMMKSSAPNHCTFTGCIGVDEFGTIMRESSEKEGLSVPFMTTQEAPTGTCGVLVCGKERSLVANLGAANLFKEAHLSNADVASAIKNAEIYYSAGFFLTVSVPSALQVAKHASDSNRVYCMNLSAPFIIEFFGDALKQMMPYVDILFSNEDEAKQYAKTNNLNTEDLTEIAKHIVALPKENTKRPRTVIFTHGKNPTVCVTQGQAFEVPVPKIEESKIVDTNGAGDAFVGGFLSRLAKDKPLEECIRAGHYSAGVIIQHSSCSFPPTPTEFQD